MKRVSHDSAFGILVACSAWAFLCLGLCLCGPASGMSRSDMREDVRDLIAEESTAYITDAELNRWINRGQYEVALLLTEDLLWELSASSTEEITIGKSEYSIPSDMLRIVNMHTDTYEVNVVFSSHGPRYRLNTSFNSDQTKPTAYIQGNSILVYPASTSAGTMTIFYTKRPSEMATDAATPDLNLVLHDLIVYYAGSKAAIKIRDYGMAQTLQRMFYEKIKFLNQRFPGKNKQEEPITNGTQTR